MSFTNTKFNVTIEVLKDENGETWFPGKEVAEALGYKDTRHAVSQHVHDDDRKRVGEILHGVNHPGKKPVVNRPFRTYINEPGLYSLVSRSQLGSAREFQRWVHKEVLPSIRKTGGYTLTSQAPPKELIELTS